MLEVNTSLSYGHFQNGRDIMPNLYFQRQLAIKCKENTIGTETGDIGGPMRDCRRPQTMEYHMEKAQNYQRK